MATKLMFTTSSRIAQNFCCLAPLGILFRIFTGWIDSRPTRGVSVGGDGCNGCRIYIRRSVGIRLSYVIIIIDFLYLLRIANCRLCNLLSSRMTFPSRLTCTCLNF